MLRVSTVLVILTLLVMGGRTTLSVISLDLLPFLELLGLTWVGRVELNQVLDLLDLEDHGDIELVKLGHLLLLEVVDLLLGLL